LNEKIIMGASNQDIRLTAKSMLAASPKCRDTRLHTGWLCASSWMTLLGTPASLFRSIFSRMDQDTRTAFILNMTIDHIATHVPNIVTPEKLSALVDDLAKA
jgi:hypothetical protein